MLRPASERKKALALTLLPEPLSLSVRGRAAGTGIRSRFQAFGTPSQQIKQELSSSTGRRGSF